MAGFFSRRQHVKLVWEAYRKPLGPNLGSTRCGPLVRSRGGAESLSSGAMPISSKCLNSPGDGRHGLNHKHRSARVGSGGAPPSQHALLALSIKNYPLQPHLLRSHQNV
jgi:hypothetical protein